jgi:hypothetical protein
MVTASLRSALALLRIPSIWLPGIAGGLFSASFLLLQFSSGAFIAERLWVLEMVVFPFFVAGLMHQVKTGERAFSSFVTGGIAGYFRVLLPSLVIFFGLLLTVFLLLIPLTLLGLAETALVFMLVAVSFTVLFFTFFYDAAAVIEERKVFDSVRRSVEFVLQQSRACLVFYLISLAIVIAVCLVIMLAWTALLYDRLEPLAAMSAAEIQSFSLDQLNALLGADGILVSALFAFFGATLVISMIYSFKACFFRDYAGVSAAVPVQGEFDEKGRWFKY